MGVQTTSMETSPRRHVTLCLDSCFALFLAFVATCFYWRGSWDTISVYVLPDSEPLNHWVRFAIGCCTALTYFSLPFVKEALHGTGKVTFLLGSRLFMIVHGIFYMFIWRGLWGLGDYYCGPDPKWAWVTLAVCYPLLLLLGASRQLMWPPYMAPNDERPDLLVAANRFQVQVSEILGNSVLSPFGVDCDPPKGKS